MEGKYEVAMSHIRSVDWCNLIFNDPELKAWITSNPDFTGTLLFHDEYFGNDTRLGYSYYGAPVGKAVRLLNGATGTVATCNHGCKAKQSNQGCVMDDVYVFILYMQFLSASFYVSKRGTYWDRLCRDVVGRWLVGRWLVGRWLVVGCHARALWPNGAS